MSHASGVVIYGPTGSRGEIGRGPRGALYAIHFFVPVLCTAAVLQGETSGWAPDLIVLDIEPQGIARDIAVMVLTQLNGGTSPVPLYPFEPRDESDTGLVFRNALYGAVDEAVAASPPISLHLVRFDSELLNDATADELRSMGFAVETFDSNERPMR